MKPILVGALLLIATAAAAANLPVRRLALFVGANQGGNAQQPLLYAQRDALKVQQVMEEVGGVTSADRILLLDPSPDQIRAALRDLGSRLPSGESRRTEFLFYYSGHSDDEGLLLGNRALSYKDLRDSLQTVRADVRIAILDSCSSGAFARLKGGVQRASFLGQDSSQMKGHAFLTSSSENEASQESDSLQGSFFTHYLVSALRGGADRAGDGLVTLNEAYEYAFQNTLARTESTKAGPQHPSYEIQLSGTGDLILSDVKTSDARLELSPAVQGKVYVRNPGGQLFAEVNKDVGAPLTLGLPAGSYTVTAVSDKTSTAQVVLASKGVRNLSPTDFSEQSKERNAVRGTEESSDSTELLGFGLSLIPGLPGSGWGESKAIALGAIIDYAFGIHGLQASSIMSLNDGGAAGVQMAGVGAITLGRVEGFQFGGVFSIAQEGTHGGQFSGVFNISNGEVNGLFQSAGVFNLSTNTYRGAQFATVNIADRIDGVQAGVVNIAGDVNGFQLGLVNINRSLQGGGFGLIFISPDAFYHPTWLYDSRGENHALLQWGMGSMYWVTGVVGSSWSEGRWGGTGGIGFHLQKSHFFWDTDAGWFGSFRQDSSLWNAPYVKTAAGFGVGVVSVETGLMGIADPNGSAFSIGPFSARVQTRWFAGVRLL